MKVFNNIWNFQKDGIEFQILTRTSSRPNGFRKCHQSIQKQKFRKVNHTASYENSEDLNYIGRYSVNKIKVDPSPKKFSGGSPKGLGKEFKHYNLYCNDLLDSVEEGWILFLDDDDMLAHKGVLKRLQKQIRRNDDDTLFIWRTKFPDGSVLPPDVTFINKEIKLAHIDTACFMFHSKYKDKARWDQFSAADFRFIRDLAEVIPKQIWIDEVLTLKNNFGDGGRRNDIKN